MSNVTRRIFKYLLAAVDIAVVCAAYVAVVMLLPPEMASTMLKTEQIEITLIIASAVYVLALTVTGSYNRLWRYAGLAEYFRCCAGCIGALVITSLIATLTSGIVYVPGVHILSGIIITFICVCIRVVPRLVTSATRISAGRKLHHQKKTVNLLIVGAGEAAKKVINDIRMSDANYNIVGVIDDDIRKSGAHVFGTKVLGTRQDIVKICEKYDVGEILLAIPSIGRKDKKDILSICNKTLLRVRTLPSLSEIINYDDLHEKARDIRIEDLLERDTIKLDNKKIAQYINGKTVLVTGGGGSIGSELCRQIARFEPKVLYVLDIYENNAYDLQNELMAEYPGLNLKIIIASVRDSKRMDDIFKNIRPDIVFHAAAHKHVPLMETNSSEAIKNNVMGTFKTAMCAHRYAVKRFVLISTDKAVNPTNVMGATKRIAEMIIQSLDAISKTEFVAVRFGNVLGSNGSVVPLFKKQIENGGPVTLTHKDITRFFMTIPEAAQLVLEAASYAAGGEIFVLDMGEPVKIYDLAQNMIRLSGYEPGRDIKIKEVGLRPGEKLYEELLLAEEGLEQTANNKIYIAKPMCFDWEKLNSDLKRLLDAANLFDDDAIRRVIREVVPTYRASADAEGTCGEEPCDNHTAANV